MIKNINEQKNFILLNRTMHQSQKTVKIKITLLRIESLQIVCSSGVLGIINIYKNFIEN